MSKVYIVTAGEYDDRHTVAVFSKKRVATKFVEEFNKTKDYNCDRARVSAWDLDECVGQIARFHWIVYLDPETGVIRDGGTDVKLAKRGPKSQVFKSKSHWTVYSYVSKEHASVVARKAWKASQKKQ